MKRRAFLDRLHDRCWREIRKWLLDDFSDAMRAPPAAGGIEDKGTVATSISSDLPWAQAAAVYGDPSRSTARFRRLRAVADVVETVGPSDGRFHARRIHDAWPGAKADKGVNLIDRWGSPLSWPGFLLGTDRAWSPTTLRYLSTALWLKQQGLVCKHGMVVEVGVGFGGQAAMNALVCGARTVMVDLPQVEELAARMMREVGLAEYVAGKGSIPSSGDFTFVSNYAFTELSPAIQDQYFERYVFRAARGVIISNAGVFANAIGGRPDTVLVELLRTAGVPATIEHGSEILGPGDDLCRVRVIRWDRKTRSR